MSSLVELARAKVNLTLRVLRRRPDGYHELESSVVFAHVADSLALTPAAVSSVSVTGPFAPAIVGENLLARALALLESIEPRLILGHVALEKRLPVAAGLGGGSADAAALLRAVRYANPDVAGRIDWPRLATRLGADVPVCLGSSASLIRGVGEAIEPIDVPHLPAVLVNPRVPVPADKTARVFAELGARPVADLRHERSAPIGAFATIRDVVAYVRSYGNDLAPPARRIMPAVIQVETVLAAARGALYVGVSGAGPTCFALFEASEEAEAAAKALSAIQPGWWIAATTLA
jgi:4-diphosphocytidyl-2-C-methyl-D-erythritol kinase